MRLRLGLVSSVVLMLLTLSAEPVAEPPVQGEAAADPIVMRMVDRTIKQRSELRGYSATRRYTIRNHHLSHDAVMTVLLVYKAGQGKHFVIVHEDGSSGIVRHVLLSILKEEEELSRERFPQGDINESNYRFALVGKQVRDGRMCYKLKLIPRHRSKYLIAGDLWVDEKEFAIVCLEGRSSGSVSFWVGRPSVVQHFQPENGFWMPLRSQSTAQVKLVGQTELIIDCWDYKFQAAAPDQPEDKLIQ